VFGSGFGLTAEMAKFARNKIDLGRRLGLYFPDIDGGLGYKIGARLAQKGYSKAPPPLSGAGTPAATKSPSVAGLAAMRSATDMTDGSSGADQTLRPRSQTTTWEPPSDRPSSFTRSPETFRMSDDISQEGIEASTISKALQNLAGTRKYQDTADLSILVQRLEELEPAFTDDLVEVVAALGGKEGGVEFSAVRLKASDAIEKWIRFQTVSLAGWW
jgi:hypothetical protein